jgi:hypothetical protein
VRNIGSWRATPATLVGATPSLGCTLAIVVLRMGALSGVAQAKLRAPAPQSPDNGAAVEAPPPLTWSSVKGADHYEVQVSANDRFTAPTVSFGTNAGLTTNNTAATPTKQWPDGTYYWRVRAISPADSAGAWSSPRRLVKAWETAPLLQGGDNLAISWPLTPLVLKWSIVPHAQKYLVTIATDDALSNVVLGTATKPVEIYGNVFALPSTLAPGDYSWAVTPVDSDGHRGQRSALGHFHWSWPTTTNVRIADLDSDPRVFDPQFSWDPVPGAAQYEVEVNAAQDFAPGSKWCCDDKTIGTSLSPKIVLANNAYYVRVRAFDALGNAGVWNVFDGGNPFTKQFDDVIPTIPNLRLTDVAGDLATGSTTDTPIVRWDPVPGASYYEVQTTSFQDGFGCDWTTGHSMFPGALAWTPETSDPQSVDPPDLGNPAKKLCFRIRARSDDDAQGHGVFSDWTQLGSNSTAAFAFAAQPAPGPVGGPPLATSLDDYVGPIQGQLTSRTPVFTWKRVSGARSYQVVVSRDASFTNIADVGTTNAPAYAPRLSTVNPRVPLSDETTHYYWAVFPATADNGTGINSTYSDNNFRAFDKNSTPPTPIGPVNGTPVTTQPTFRWTEAENAREYRLQVSQDPTFGSPIDDVITDSTAFTSSSTYPADTQMYWRVRANDWNGQGLNWSQTGTFIRRLVAPTFLGVDNPVTELLPTIHWSPVEGAVSYTVHVEDTVAADKNYDVASPLTTPSQITGTGIMHVAARANFPKSSAGVVSSGFFNPIAITKTLGPVKNANGLKTGKRVLITWDPDPSAKSYSAEISTTDAFGTRVESIGTANPSWAPLLHRSPGGRLYWRVTPVDDRGGHGAYAIGSFVLPKGMSITTSGLLRKGHAGHLTIYVRDAKRKAIRGAKVTITGAGLATKRAKTNRKGLVSVSVRPRKRGKITVVGHRKGFADGSAAITVR